MTEIVKVYDETHALRDALMAARVAPVPCSKSRRIVVVFERDIGLLTVGWNHPPDGFRCDGSDACRESCAQLCIHAEGHALSQVPYQCGPIEVLHVKVVQEESRWIGVPSRSPSCWQCSKTIADHIRIERMWLLLEDGLRGYSRHEFHELTLRECGLPVIR